MPVKVLMTALSPTMTEGTLVKWHKKQGDAVKAGDLLAEIETDKATMEIEAVDDGIIGKILVEEGTENVPVNKLIALILEEGEDQSVLENVSLTAQTAVFNAPPEQTLKPTTLAHYATTEPLPSDSFQRIFITPLAKRLAQQSNVDVSQIQGSGPRGRIIKADIESNLSVSKGHVTSVQSLETGGYTDIKLNGMRKMIAKRLSESKQTIPHFYLSMDCELDALLALRCQINALPHSGQKISVNDFVVRACALSLVKVPKVNATWHDSYIRCYKNADIAVAVAIDGGLITPILQAAETKSLLTISSEMRILAERARAGKLQPEEYQGGSFSVSNLGMYGVKDFSAIINPPQTCILAVGAGAQRAVVKDGQLAIATVMTCTLSVDHRAVDGAIGAKFLQVFKEFIENPLLLMV